MKDRELKRLASEFRQGILGDRPSHLMCFAICAPLQGYLEALGVQTRLVEVHFKKTNHVYLELTDGRILDPTADQFPGFPKVYLGAIPKLYRRWLREARS